MACKARWVALLLACLLHNSALAQRSSSGGTASSGASRSSGTFRATAPPPPSARGSSSSGGSSNSGSGGFVTTLGSSSRGSSTETSNSGGSSFGTLSTGSSISSLSSGSSSRGSSSQSSESAFPGGGTLTSQTSSASQSGTNSNGNNGNANGNTRNGNGNGNNGNGNGNGGSTGSSGAGTNSNGNDGSANGNNGNGNGNGNDGNGDGNGGSSSDRSSSGSSSKTPPTPPSPASTPKPPPTPPSPTSTPKPPPSPPPPTPTPTATPTAVGTITSSTKSGCGVGGSTNCAGGNSDPVMYGFAGRAFNFMGNPGETYNIISTLNIQVSMKLKLAQMWDHNGTNMEAIGFMYRNYKVLVSLDAKEDVVVTAQGRTLKVKNTAKHYAWRFDDGAYIQTTWERYKPGLGNTVTIETDVLKMTIWQTPAGIVDEGGMVLGAWLNFGLSLEAPPANGLMHGIVGGTYDRFIMGETAVSDPKSQLYLPADGEFHGKFKDEDYAMADHWDTNFPANLFGVTDPGFQAAQQGRSNLEDDTNQSAFPAFARACFLCDQTPSGQSHTF